jgi:hypothetical protein
VRAPKITTALRPKDVPTTAAIISPTVPPTIVPISFWRRDRKRSRRVNKIHRARFRILEQIWTSAPEPERIFGKKTLQLGAVRARREWDQAGRRIPLLPGELPRTNRRLPVWCVADQLRKRTRTVDQTNRGTQRIMNRHRRTRIIRDRELLLPAKPGEIVGNAARAV